MLKKILKYILAIAILCYLAFAFVIVPLQKDNDSCRGVAIQITNNRLGTISNDDIVDMLRDGELYPEGENFNSISCSRIEEYNFLTTVQLTGFGHRGICILYIFSCATFYAGY